MKKEKILSIFLIVVLLLNVLAIGVCASPVSDSDLAKGTEKLIADLTVWAIIVCVAVAGCAAVYCFIRKSMADEQDQVRWNKRIVTAIVCGVGGSVITGVISLILSYYTQTPV